MGILDKIAVSTVTMEGYGALISHKWQVSVTLGIDRLPPWTYQVYISPIQEYILGIDVCEA